MAEFGAELPALRMLPLPGAQIMRSYYDGGAVIGFPFSITLRCRPGGGEFAARTLASLNALADYMRSADLPDLDLSREALALELSSAPQRTSSTASGYVEFSAEFRLMFISEPVDN